MFKELQGYEVTRLRVYPNPTNAELRVTKLQGYEVTDCEIYNIVGQKLAPFNSPEGGKLPSFGGVGGGEIVIDVSHLAKGMYFLRIDGKVVKFVKD